MRILCVEDSPQDITGLEALCGVRQWELQVADNFGDAAYLLADDKLHYDVVLIDVQLPWGSRTPEVVRSTYSDEHAGLILLEGMRGAGRGESILREQMELNLARRHADTPVIILTKIEAVRTQCRDLGIVEFFSKFSYSFCDLVESIGAIGAAR